LIGRPSRRPASPGEDRGSPVNPAEQETLDAMTAGPMGDELRREAEACGGQIEPLADGSVGVTPAKAIPAHDQAALAGAWAPGLRRCAAGRRVALATGHGELNGRLPVGDAIDRAARLIARSTFAGPQEGALPVALDEVTAGLLDARFAVEEI